MRPILLRQLAHSLLALVPVLPFAPPSASAATEFFVAPAGNDSWSGMLPDPNPEGTDGPFASPRK
ncbi:MAG: hypothetical protein ACYC6Y_05625, partial [Thermoguttaceae bacterium]